LRMQVHLLFEQHDESMHVLSSQRRIVRDRVMCVVHVPYPRTSHAAASIWLTMVCAAARAHRALRRVAEAHWQPLNSQPVYGNSC
jgi:hypothetical protein